MVKLQVYTTTLIFPGPQSLTARLYKLGDGFTTWRQQQGHLAIAIAFLRETNVLMINRIKYFNDYDLVTYLRELIQDPRE